MDDLMDFLEENIGKVFRYQVYKRMFTPYEKKQKFEDETEFTDNMYYCYGLLNNVIKLPNNEVMLEIEMMDLLEKEPTGNFAYYNLNEIRLYKFGIDNENIEREEGHVW